MRVAATALTVVALMASGPAAPSAVPVAWPGGSGPLTWHVCPPTKSVPHDSPLRCASVQVPVDYARPEGPRVKLTVSRLRASDPRHRRGVLLLNPGGPGGPGVAMPVWWSATVPASVRAHYDLIGFDTRGLAASSGVSCHLSVHQLDNLPLAPPLYGKPFSATAELQRSVGRSCARHAGPLVPTMYTKNNARDMDRIRAALKERRISYYGVSYGSYLGAVYAQMFPRRTERLILDSVVDTSATWRRRFRLLGLGSEQRYPDFTHYLATHDATYHLGRDTGRVGRILFTLIHRLDRHPVVVGRHKVSGTVLRQLTLQGLYSDSDFRNLALLWQFLAHAPGAPSAERVRTPLDALYAKALDPVFNQLVQPSAAATMCQDDRSWPRSVAPYRRSLREDSRRYPVSGPMSSDIFPCAFWPYRPREAPAKITGRGPRNILLLQNLRDPATPYIGAQATRRALGRRAALAGVEQGGHGVYGFTPNRCASAVATAWLVDGALPRRDIRCPGTR
ncbi:alpha/beta hydrolase [Streptomyces piniterrae]|uniref:Alpha/beta hydrolase n=1 Tax=Streptomyces piniterrae TaxID=2571125 RepID=A0A4U0N4Q6_9ACTN|nr:alpha/beta hydrolase [Streptomyces piniterrae]TJZ44584.1 alpha/beta hydrolase [Streptomyces piniterrae]